MAMTIPIVGEERAPSLTPSDAIAIDLKDEAEEEIRRLTHERLLIARSERPVARRQRREPIVPRRVTRHSRLDGLFLIFRFVMERHGRPIHGETVTVEVPGLEALGVIH